MDAVLASPAADARPLPLRWQQIVQELDYAFQPVVNSHSGVCFAFEALLRHTDRHGFASIQDFFDACARDNVLADMEVVLRDKAIAKFALLPFADRVKLFLNVDNRAIDQLPLLSSALDERLALHGLTRSGIVFEISERHPVHDDGEMLLTLERIKAQGLDMAIDDFGVGFSGLQLLYRVEPNYIKVDRFFISDIGDDIRKRFLLSHIVDIARLLGITVIAEGVETEREFLICKEIGCDLIQGYLVQRPTCDLADLKVHYGEIEILSSRERRRKTSDYHVIKDNLETPEPLLVTTPMMTVLQMFSERPKYTYFPVIDAMGVPLGVVREVDVKYLVYSRFGRDLMSNKSFTVNLGQVVSRCPTVDINSRAEKILEVFSVENPAQCAIVTENMQYLGTLNAHSLLGILTEKNLTTARDQNPLTRMAGNTLIEEFVSESLMDAAEDYVFVYFDFDHFKPFNDCYGFRLGDRAILMFSEIMRRKLRTATFLGHIGGDDFFAGFRGLPLDAALASVTAAQEDFASDVRSLYDSDVRALGYMPAEDRDGNAICCPLLTVSAAVLRIAPHGAILTTEEVVRKIAALKKAAKQSPDRLALFTLEEAPISPRDSLPA